MIDFMSYARRVQPSAFNPNNVFEAMREHAAGQLVDALADVLAYQQAQAMIGEVTDELSQAQAAVEEWEAKDADRRAQVETTEQAWRERRADRVLHPDNGPGDDELRAAERAAEAARAEQGVSKRRLQEARRVADNLAALREAIPAMEPPNTAVIEQLLASVRETA